VPTRTFGGVLLAVTISEMKLAVMPMMAISDTACMPRTTVKVAPRAPWFGIGMVNIGLKMMVKVVELMLKIDLRLEKRGD
jgi:hypothetical protein